MRNRIKKICIGIFVLIFWLAVWEIAAITIDLEFILPTVEATFKSLLELLKTKELYITVFSSVLRIFSSLFLGIIIAITLAIFSIRIPLLKTLISPAMTIAKSTPVAVIIIILWLMIGGANVPAAIAVLMVMPIIWQNVIDGYNAVDHKLEEVCMIYQFGFLKKLRLLILPTVFKFLFPGLITASGLAWKAGIAAEIICMTKNSIGKEIYNSKYLLDGPRMFAYTIIVLILSYLIEVLIRFAVERIGKKWHL